MIQSVTIHGLNDQGKDAMLGRIIWDGWKFHVDPDGVKNGLQQLLETEIVVPIEGRVERLSSRKQPEAFLRHLCEQYRSAYCRAGEVVEVS